MNIDHTAGPSPRGASGSPGPDHNEVGRDPWFLMALGGSRPGHAPGAHSAPACPAKANGAQSNRAPAPAPLPDVAGAGSPGNPTGSGRTPGNDDDRIASSARTRHSLPVQGAPRIQAEGPAHCSPDASRTATATQAAARDATHASSRPAETTARGAPPPPPRRMLLLPASDGTELFIRDYRSPAPESNFPPPALLRSVALANPGLQRIHRNGLLIWERPGGDTSPTTESNPAVTGTVPLSPRLPVNRAE